ncbi:terminase TerL endonuclease subunit [Lysinibacillus fusiformis]|uniref:Phage terminase-like protein, large subunit, contains N-terminal HTH domain n=1 Tax=Lysinibacillus fusiformis TaxID=28031 RepID=A0A1H9QJ09_9BACI|nr:terminase TerL endonuclease subunit [Lysinibacillus fusiformis]SCY77872.1 Phage terminase-like protein, large subunit, contains N-terminal HTH domain [Lysinibacillus fusiformis]SEO37570.1 Phage terminase-like protein, large subunit, contains N-terminal HTH domain [Lysinibacillus fusiformis]SER60442.1 Phage terminase-like protein, large subunit, contains N-terminal HTH domain [Lysinibacillus fusiformis]
MISNKYVDEYIQLYESGQIKLNNERIMLIEYLREHVLSRDDLFFDDDMIEKCIRFGEKWYFPLQPFQKFLIAFVFLFFKKNGRVFYRKHLWMLGRGGGKNGLISVVTHFLIGPHHGIREYNVSIVANSEEQAKTSFDETYNVIGRNSILKSMFYRTKEKITSNKTDSILKFRTSNGETKDGLRDGAVVFDEIHQFESNKDVRVHISGLGKKKNPREFYIGTDGYVRDGFLDKQKEKAMKVLSGEARPNALFPFICKLDDEKEVDEIECWEKANPMLCHPRSDYAQGLFDTIFEEYEDLEDDPTNREEFMTKRMNCPVTDLERSVAKWEEILATNREMPNLHGREAIGAIDFASIRDFAACGLLFRENGDYVWKTHSYARKEFVDKYYSYSKKQDAEMAGKRKFAPIREWEEQGLLSVVEGETIDPNLVVSWFVEMRNYYDIKKVIGDNFRMEVLKPLFEAEGFEVEIIRNPRAIHSLLAPRIELAFANRQIIFGDNPLMRWYTNNVLVVIKKDGNKEYQKKEPIRRKTDGFQAFVHAIYRADEVAETDIGSSLDALNALNF